MRGIYAYPFALSQRSVKKPKNGGIAKVMPRNTITVASAGAGGMPNAVNPPVSAASCTPIPPGTGATLPDHTCTDLHDDQLGVVQALVEGEAGTDPRIAG